MGDGKKAWAEDQEAEAQARKERRALHMAETIMLEHSLEAFDTLREAIEAFQTLEDRAVLAKSHFRMIAEAKQKLEKLRSYGSNRE